MKYFAKNLSFLLILLSSTIHAQKKVIAVEAGVSIDLATFRKSTISDIQYVLDFNIPADKKADIIAKETLLFNLKAISQSLQIDFKQRSEKLKQLVVNGKPVPKNLKDEHIIIAQQYLKKGLNKIDISFVAGNDALNRNNDYLYTLLVPEHARNTFPCFDQPDLKANFLLTLTVPSDWKVLANGSKKDSINNQGFTTFHFNNSDKLPTYLFAFIAGKFIQLNKNIEGRNMEFLHRETDSSKIKLSTDSIIYAHKDALNFLEEWTAIKYPFKKFGFVAIPDFQFGGMEHPGAIEYKASSLFLDSSATKDQLISRSTLISHETAHMWFGNLVTMQWFNDVWMKEVFANFMADKVSEKMMGQDLFNLKFLQDHYPAAYGIDRTLGANPIRQQLDNLKDAGSMYGNIIYHKAPIMMRQLELLMGKGNFQKGIQEYLKMYAYKNATWPDLISILSKYSKADLNKWNKVWVNQPGRPVFEYDIKYKNEKISTFEIKQTPEMGATRIWPQAFDVKLVYKDHSESMTVNMKDEKIILTAADGLAKPLYVLFNTNGIGYGVFPIDKDIKDNVFKSENPVERTSAYINAYENMLSGKYYLPIDLLEAFTKCINSESNEMNLRLLANYISNIYWTFISPKERLAFSEQLEQTIWQEMEAQELPNHKKILFNAYQNIYLSSTANKSIYEIWKNKAAPAGIKLVEDDYTAMALTIALKNDTASSVLPMQLNRITNVDRKNRLMFLMPALSSNVLERDQFFNSLSERKNREKEAWVTTALSYLQHPLRQGSSQKYLPQSLNMLEEIQKTGDIFFPQSWLASIFGNYQNKLAYQVVTDFLKNHPNYNPKLKDKILQATDNLYRAQKLVK